MKPQSAKAKGRRLQQDVRDQILKAFPSLEPGDVRSASMGAPGADLQLSPAAAELFPFTVECKNQQGINIWTALAQADRDPALTPLLVFRRNSTQAYAAIPFGAFLTLVRRANVSSTTKDSGRLIMSDTDPLADAFDQHVRNQDADATS